MATGYFSFSSSLRLVFSFVLFFFLLFFSFSLFSSHFPFISPHFLFSFWSFSHPFWSHHTSVKGRKLPPHFLKLKVWLSLFHIYFSYFLMTSSPHGFIWGMEFLFPHMAHCEPFFHVDHMALPSVTLLWFHMASPYLAMCHPTPHASKNAKSRPPRNLTKFDVVAQFRETISTEKFVSSSEI